MTWLLFLMIMNTSAFLIEDWYKNLNHFGPLVNEDWNARPMTLVADFTYRIENLDYSANMPFMFVSNTEVPIGTQVPPLGPYNWKQGKIGMNSLTSLQPGGGPGYISMSGRYNFTLRTTGHPTDPDTLDLEVSSPLPSVLIETLHSVIRSPSVVLQICFSEPVHFNPNRIIYFYYII